MAISSANTGLRAGVCTSTTRPSNPYLGQIIYQTDDGQMLVWNGSSWGTLNPTANRNVIINGNFDIWQRGQNFTTDNAATRIYTADRWCARALYPNSGAVQVITRDTANVPTGSQYALKSVIGTAAVVNNSRMQLAYTIENADAVKLAGKQMVLTLQAKSIQNIDRITIQPTYNTAGGNTYDGTAISTTNFTVNTSSFTTCTVFFTMPAIGTLTTSGSAGFVISYTRSSGSAEQVGDGIYLSQVQMEVGTQATSFEQRPIGAELQLCQRYFQRHEFSANGYAGFADSATSFLAVGQFSPQMRTAPNLNPAPTVSDFEVRRAGIVASAVTGISFNTTITGTRLTVATSSLTASAGGIFTASSGTKYLNWEAEL